MRKPLLFLIPEDIFLMIPMFPVLASGGQVSSHAPVDRTCSIGVTKEAIQIDGVLTEDVWTREPVATDFWMTYPVDNRALVIKLNYWYNF